MVEHALRVMPCRPRRIFEADCAVASLGLHSVMGHDLCVTVGISSPINRLHATFLTDVHESTLAEVEAGNREPGVCPIPMPRPPAS